MIKITDLPCKCTCGWSGTVYDCEPDIDGDGGLGCPECNKVIEVTGPSIRLGPVTTLNYILRKFNLENYTGRMPIDIPIGRADLARLFAELDFKAGAEIGVEEGLFTEVLCQANPQAKIYGIDAWHAYSRYREHVSQDKLAKFYEAAQARLLGYNCELMRRFSMEAVKDFTDGELDFVYIDANHDFQHVVNDLAEWSKKVRAGGIVAGHDYRKTKNNMPFHVIQATQAFTSAYRISPWFVLRGDHRAASFMWVK